MGALEAIEENGLTIERVAGTSAGAIVAALLAAGFQAGELKKELQETDNSHLLDPSK